MLDLEHVPVDAPQAIEHLRAIGNTKAAPVVRLPWNDLVWIKRILDAGGQTIMVPFVQNAEEAKRAVAAARYAPEGIRGVAAVHRASQYGADATYLRNANAQTYVIVQLETPEAVAAAPEIAAVKGVDALFLGPGISRRRWGIWGRSAMRRCRRKSPRRRGRRSRPASRLALSGRTRRWCKNF
ncbi:HpcH/HpaI aldolase family protein [Acidocella sp. MX-AZ03]|uniref:HpcH/HpaI aldolase family protein n=1 Tax=Acidocella sp. MX-AZ03 TaxID=2697363 RepID=UPI003FA44C1D